MQLLSSNVYTCVCIHGRTRIFVKMYACATFTPTMDKIISFVYLIVKNKEKNIGVTDVLEDNSYHRIISHHKMA